MCCLSCPELRRTVFLSLRLFALGYPSFVSSSLSSSSSTTLYIRLLNRQVRPDAMFRLLPIRLATSNAQGVLRCIALGSKYCIPVSLCKCDPSRERFCDIVHECMCIAIRIRDSIVATPKIQKRSNPKTHSDNCRFSPSLFVLTLASLCSAIFLWEEAASYGQFY